MSIRIKMAAISGAVLICALLILIFFYTSSSNGNLKSTKATSTPSEAPFPQDPIRDWSVLDPAVPSQALLIESLNDGFPFFRYKIHEAWPMASLTKLLTAVVVTEQIGLNTKIPITQRAVETEGIAGDLKSGEVYTARDLLKIMLMVSSNDAAAAFEEFGGGKEAFVNMMRKKAREIGLQETIVNDASGLDDNNTTTADDMLKLLKYVIEKDPDIISWTRLQTFPVQAINDVNSRIITNIDSLVVDPDFLGGKTGTSPKAGENLAAVFSFGTRRVGVIILGSKDRIREVHDMLRWVKQAYKVQ